MRSDLLIIVIEKKKGMRKESVAMVQELPSCFEGNGPYECQKCHMHFLAKDSMDKTVCMLI